MAPEEAEVDEHKPQENLLPQGAPNALLGMAPAPDTLQPLAEDLWLPFHQHAHEHESDQQDGNGVQAGQSHATGSGLPHHEISIHIGDVAEGRPARQTAEV